MKTRGTPAQRAEQRQETRAARRLRHIRELAAAASSGHQLVTIACNAALAASRRITDDTRRQLARTIAEAVERLDTPTNRKERR